MASNHYEFLTHWRVQATPEEIFPIIDGGPECEYTRWWPAVWLKVEDLDPGDANGLGARARLTSKGWLPYILRWESTVVDKVPPRRKVIRASGNLEGEGIWTLEPDGKFVNIDYQWRIVATKPLLKYLSFALRPLFAFNHNWAMARGRESLQLELARRRAQTPEERARIPPPPQPTFLGRRKRRRLGL